MTRSACGRTTSRRILPRDNPSAVAASVWPRSTARIAAPDDLGDERRRIGRQADQQRGELRRDRQAPAKVEADEQPGDSMAHGRATSRATETRPRTGESPAGRGQRLLRERRPGSRVQRIVRGPAAPATARTRTAAAAAAACFADLDVHARRRRDDPDIREARDADHESQRGRRRRCRAGCTRSVLTRPSSSARV